MRFNFLVICICFKLINNWIYLWGIMWYFDLCERGMNELSWLVFYGYGYMLGFMVRYLKFIRIKFEMYFLIIFI